MILLLIFISLTNSINCMDRENQIRDIYAHSYLDTTRIELERIHKLIVDTDKARESWINDQLLQAEALNYLGTIKKSTEYLEYQKESNSQSYAQLRQSLFTAIFFKEFVNGISQLQSDNTITRKLKILSLVNYEIFNRH